MSKYEKFNFKTICSIYKNYIQKLKIIFIVKQELFRNVCHMMNNRDRVLINSVRIIIVLFLIK